MMARVLERSRSILWVQLLILVVAVEDLNEEETLILTKRASPASTNGLVVNHSHINALVEPSLTELISPRMSLLTMTS